MKHSNETMNHTVKQGEKKMKIVDMFFYVVKTLNFTTFSFYLLSSSWEKNLPFFSYEWKIKIFRMSENLCVLLIDKYQFIPEEDVIMNTKDDPCKTNEIFNCWPVAEHLCWKKLRRKIAFTF